MTVAESLLPEEYQQIVAPALKAAAELAAARGDPYLFNELPCMISLMVLVKGMADRYQDKWGALGQSSASSVFEQAPVAACVMVLNEYEVEETSISAMTAALSKAYSTLQSENIFGAESVQLQKAWEAQLAENDELCAVYLRQAATSVAKAVDAWEQKKQVN
ncbi:MAG: hypothetical protein AAF387_15445 [Pseudomonadota bacterium]